MTTIGRSITVTGDVQCDEDLVIQGRVKGGVTVRSGAITIEREAHLESNVRGARVVIRGYLKGNVQAAERIELQETANVTGSLSATRVVVADGANFRGGIDMGQRTIAAKMAQYKASQA